MGNSRSSAAQIESAKQSCMQFCEAANPPIQRCAVARALKLQPAFVGYVLNKLVRDGRLLREGDRGAARYFLPVRKGKAVQGVVSFKSKTPVFKELPVDKLRACRLQPHARTDAGRMRELDGQITDEGRIHNPIIVVPNGDGTYTIADGHRRCSVARRRGWPTVPCQIQDNGTPVEVLWARLNTGTCRFQSTTWFVAWSKCEPSERKTYLASAVPPRHRQSILRMIDIFGESAAVDYAQREWVAPEASKQISTLHDMSVLRLKGDSPSMREIGEWLLASRPRRGEMFRFPELVKSVRPWRAFAKAVRNGANFTKDQWV